VGVYPTDTGGAYRLYRKADCTGCSFKPQCTDSKGRRLKVPVGSSEAAPMNAPGWHSIEPEEGGSESTQVEAEENEEATEGPRGSLTDPEAVLMLATSQKRFEPSYNADLTVTRHGVIVSQFLTKETTDFGHFPRALPSVLSTLGTPDAWAGDGHYSTVANLLLADQAGVTLYAPLADRDPPENGKFAPDAFRHDPQKDVLVCPAGQELPKVGTYGEQNGRPYDLYARKDCGNCPLKSQCTDSRGRRVKRFQHHPLVQALEARMEEMGEKIQRFRRETVEPVNAQIKQHGLGRFHVRGLARCGTVLALACIAHNLMKWKAREQARALKLAS
jgi:transposase